MKWKMCQCELNGLVRPDGAVKIKETEVVSPDVLVAKLGGAVKKEVAVVKEGKDFYFVAPGKKPEKVPADSLTDGLHAKVFMLNEEIREKKKVSDFRRRPMPHVEVGQKKAKKA